MKTPAEIAAEKEAADKAAAEKAAADKLKTGGDQDAPLTAAEAKALRNEIAKLTGINKTIIEERDTLKNSTKAAEDAAALQKATEEGKLKELYEGIAKELEGLKSKAEKFDSTIQSLFDAEIAVIPEDKRAFIPALPLEERLKWVKDAKIAGMFGNVAGVTAPIVQTPGQAPIVAKKSELNNQTRKAFIDKNGLDAYLALPA